MRMRLVVILLLVVGLVASWQAEMRAGLQQRIFLRSLVAQLEPYGRLSHGQTAAHFWGSGEISQLRFVPSASFSARYALPPDFALQIPRLRYRDWQGGERWPTRVYLQFDQARLPLAAPWPQSYGGSLHWNQPIADGALRLALQLQAANAADLEANLTLQLARPASFIGATLLSGQLHYRDLGLAQRQRAALALQPGNDPENASHALAVLWVQWLQDHGVPAPPAQELALSRFAAEPGTLRIRLDPPGALRPETLPQFAPADRAAALGLSMQAN